MDRRFLVDFFAAPKSSGAAAAASVSAGTAADLSAAIPLMEAASFFSPSAASSSSSSPSFSSPPLHLFEDEHQSCFFRRCFSGVKRLFCGVQPEYKQRLLFLTGETYPRRYPTNAIKNTKYNFLTFLPIVLLHQFKFFFNFFYLAVALAQLLPVLQVGPLFTYLAPLAFVQFVSIAKEAYDDYKRYVRDREMNEQAYKRLTPDGLERITAAEIRVGQIIQINANQRVPADVVFLRTTDASGSCFIRTDQLDGETDWKLRRAVHSTQHLPAAADLFNVRGWCCAEAPHLDIEEFAGQLALQLSPSLLPRPPGSSGSGNSSTSRGEESPEVPSRCVTSSTAASGAKSFAADPQQQQEQQPPQQQQQQPEPVVEGLSLENVLWANTVVTSGSVLGLAIYTGKETRAAMNASHAKQKVGLFDLELNLMSKVLFAILAFLAFVLVAFRKLEGIWHVYFLRFVLLLSSIIPVSLQVNLVMAKTLYSIFIMKDKKMKDTVVRTSTIPEELGRIDFLLTDKTGTLTQNDMRFKRLHVGRAVFAEEAGGVEQLRLFVQRHFQQQQQLKKKQQQQQQNTCATEEKKQQQGEGGVGVEQQDLLLHLDGGKQAQEDRGVASDRSRRKGRREGRGEGVDGSSSNRSPGRRGSSSRSSQRSSSGSRNKTSRSVRKKLLRRGDRDEENEEEIEVCVDSYDGENGDVEGQRDAASGAVSSSSSSSFFSSPPSSSAVFAAATAGRQREKGRRRSSSRGQYHLLLPGPSSSSTSPSSAAAAAAAPSFPLGKSVRDRGAGGGGAAAGSEQQQQRNWEGARAAVEAVLALSLCHNVTPVQDGAEISFQAASPDEVALVRFASDVGVRLVYRDDTKIEIEVSGGERLAYEVLLCFPFSSETKKMGIILRATKTQQIVFYVKGAEAVMLPLLQPKGSQWVAEESDNFARQGLRTLVLAEKQLAESEFFSFMQRYSVARAALVERNSKCRRELQRLERDLRLLGLTGVEDKLQHDVPATLESLRHAGIRIWMLTGDKVETAICVAVSAGLKARQHAITVLSSKEDRTPSQTQEALERFAMGPAESVLVVDGRVLACALQHFSLYFLRVAAQAPAVICCRCSPTQKAEVVRLLKTLAGRRTCAIGDGGNDVSMIQAADVGVGIAGKEGRQASLAADYSITQFCFLRRLLLWHGRNAYQRSAKLAQFVIHRGLIIAFIQVIFSAIFYFIPLAIFQGWLQVGYATYYTMAPVFSLVLDVELREEIVFMFPELYQSLKSGRILSVKTFFGWVWTSIYQAAVIMTGAIALFENSFMNIVSITFTSLILSELLNVASEIQTWHPLMIASEICTVIIYIFSMFILRSYFDVTFIMTFTFWAKVTAVTLVSWLPIQIFKILKKVFQPPQYAKLADM